MIDILKYSTSSYICQPLCDEMFHDKKVQNSMNVVELIECLISTFASSCHVLETDYCYNIRFEVHSSRLAMFLFCFTFISPFEFTCG